MSVERKGTSSFQSNDSERSFSLGISLICLASDSERSTKEKRDDSSLSLRSRRVHCKNGNKGKEIHLDASLCTIEWEKP